MAAEPAATQVASAPAKINLTLHVTGRRNDGYHGVESLIAFADIADRLTLTPGPELTLTVDGPTARASGPTETNLVLRAARVLAQRVARLKTGAFHLTKHLPAAAGIGGGSSDAAAALRLLAAANGLASDDPLVMDAARALGADVPVCVRGTPSFVTGTGTELSPPLALPALAAVLVNAGVAVETAAVFAALGLVPGSPCDGAPHPAVLRDMDGPALLEMLAAARNDLEPCARRVAPVIDDVLGLLRRQDRVQLARMSGSGGTCFGIFADPTAALAAAIAIRKARPGWWVQPVTIG